MDAGSGEGTMHDHASWQPYAARLMSIAMAAPRLSHAQHRIESLGRIYRTVCTCVHRSLTLSRALCHPLSLG